MSRLKTLASITDVLLDDATTQAQLAETIDEYRDLLLTASGVDLGEATSVNHFDTGRGVAIGATWAALCVDDTVRTKRFVSGLYQAVTEVVTTKDGPVHVLYAGTGPFATLALPLMTRFTPDQLQFTCIEITDESFTAVQRLFEDLGLQDYVSEVIQTDAATYRIDHLLPIDIMLSETMQYCLIDEMQVPIALNLMAQLPAQAIMIPSCITLRLGVLDGKGEEVTDDLGEIFRVDKASLAAFQPTVTEPDFPVVRLSIPPHALMGLHTEAPGPLAICTLIDIYGDYGLTHYESGLTIPSIIGDYPTGGDPLDAIDFSYRVDPSPLLWMEFIVPEVLV